MKDFYKEHEGYKKLCKTLHNWDYTLETELMCIVQDAIMYGFDKCENAVKKQWEKKT